MKKLIIGATALAALPLLALDAVRLPDIEPPLWILCDTGKTVFVFETIRLM